MRLVELVGTSTYLTEYRGKRWNFVKGKIQQVPPLLAEKLLATGDFVDVIKTVPEFTQGGIITNALSTLPDKEVKETIVPLSSLPKDFNKLEVSVDLKKVEAEEIGKEVAKEVKKRRPYKKREK